ncbi:AlpA family phage regulatory protein [Burkholderia ubonensis]
MICLAHKMTDRSHSVRIGSRSVGWKLSEIERFLASLGTEVGDA